MIRELSSENRYFAVVVCATTLLAAPIQLLAAEGASTNAPPPTSAEPAEPTQLPTVTVTAQKEPVEAESLPVSVTPVTSETLRDAAVREVEDAGIYAPNVFLNEFSARKLSNPYFRGVGASPNNPGVTTYIDGVPQLNGNSSSIELIDVDQVEFVRGPQGALFGRNTVGGLLNITSRRPSPEWTGFLEGEYGNYDYQRIQLSLSGPIAREQLGLGIAGGYSVRDGYTKNDVTGHRLDDREGFFGKGQLLWTPTPDWDVRMILFGERDRDGDYALGDLDAIRSRPHHVAHDFEGYTRRDIVAPTLLAHRYGEKVDFDATTGFIWWETRDLTDLDYTPFPAVIRDNSEEAWQVTEELRLSSTKDAPLDLSDDLKLTWQAGASFFAQDYEQDALNSYSPGILYGPPLVPFPSPANTRHAPQSSIENFGVGAFAQTTLTAWEKVDLGLGVRGDYEEADAELNTFFSTPDPILGPPIRSTPDRSFWEVSPQFSLAWRPVAHKTFYGTIARGYKAGGFNPIAPPGLEAYDEEFSWNYEVGAKTAWFDNRLALNLALFYIHWDELQLNQPVGPGEFYISNAGAAHSKGIELELRARPLRGWDLFGGIGYTDARFLSGASAGRTDPFGNNSVVNVGGNHLIFSPDYTANAGMQYSWPVCRYATLYARAEVVVYGRYFYNAANTAHQDAYSLANFRAGVRGDHWFAEGWVRNAFDTDYVPIAFEFPNGLFGGSGFVGENGAPVTFGVRAGLMF